MLEKNEPETLEEMQDWLEEFDDDIDWNAIHDN